jgi:hypothetical protein
MKYLIFFIGIFLLACAGSKEVIREDVDPEIVLVYDESFDPLSLEDDDIVIGIESSAIDSEGGTSNKSQDAITIKEINGFRIQILATNDISKASLFELEAAERFKFEGHKTYLLFEAPLYKIRVGDCKTRQEADKLRDLAKKYGYREAFLVKTKIIFSENN